MIDSKYFITPVMLLLLPAMALAQQGSKLPYDSKLLMLEPEMGMGQANFKPTAQVRGMRGLNGVTLWVTANNQSLAAYKGNQLLWKTDLVAACPHATGVREIKAVVSQSPVAYIFAVVGDHTFVEVDRKSGKVTSVKEEGE